MKISYRTNSAIKIIEDGSLKNCMVCDDDLQEVQSKGIADDFRLHSHNFKDIKIITNPFYSAMERSIGKIENSDLFFNEYSGFGTFVFKNDGIMETYCYDFLIKNAEFKRITLFYFHGNSLIKYCNSEKRVEYICSALPKSKGSTIISQLSWLFDYFLFTKYAEIETKQLSPGQKINGIKCKYKNDTSSYIKILDSTWFTNLVKSDAFKVRGHFRLQPCGHGLKDRKLIWINEFMKEGYTAPARKLNA